MDFWCAAFNSKEWNKSVSFQHKVFKYSHSETSHFVVAVWTRRGPRLQRLYLLKDEVDLSLRGFIVVVASADTHKQLQSNPQCCGNAGINSRIRKVRKDRDALMFHLAAQRTSWHPTDELRATLGENNSNICTVLWVWYRVTKLIKLLWWSSD